nr:MAG TPA: hypothetical protein [Caudoviricetes sp.]
MSRKDGGKLAKLNLKQQKFADEYIISEKYGSVYCIELRRWKEWRSTPNG